MGYTATEGLILTGQGSTNDITIKNDADVDVMTVPTGTTNATFVTTRNTTGLEINDQTGTSYTTVLTDAGKIVTMTNAGASTLTIPPNSSVAYPVGAIISVEVLGAGAVTLTE